VCGVADLGDDLRAADEGEETEGQVHEEDPAPARFDEQTADGRACGSADARDCRPEPDHRRVLARWEHRQDQPERGGRQRSAPDRLENAGADQEVDRGRGGRERGADEEDKEAGEEDALAADDVGELAGGDEHGGEDDRVGAEDPREAGEAGGWKAAPDVREGDVDDEQIENRQEDGDREDAERAPGFGLSAGLLHETHHTKKVSCATQLDC